jgi:hypothetical protein
MTSALDSVLGCFQIIPEVGFLYTESMHARWSFFSKPCTPGKQNVY